MAFANKYYQTFYDITGTQWGMYIQKDGYAGGTIQYNRIADDPLHITWECEDVEDKFCPIMTSMATMKWVIENSGANLREIMSATAMQYRIKLFKAGVEFWRGYILPGYYQEAYTDTYPTVITLTAVDGLTYLKDIPFLDSSSVPMTGLYSLLNLIGIICDKINPGIPYVDYINLIEDSQTDSNTTSALKQTYIKADLFYDEKTGVPLKCWNVLSQIMSIFGARIINTSAVWRFIRISEQYSGNMHWVWYNNDLSYNTNGTSDHRLSLTQSGVSISTRLVPVGNNAVLTSKLSAKSVTVRYQKTKKKNLIINGYFTFWSGGLPVGWSGTINGTVEQKTGGTNAYYLRFGATMQAGDHLTRNLTNMNDMHSGGLLLKLRYRNSSSSAQSFKIQIWATGGGTDYYVKSDGTWTTLTPTIDFSNVPANSGWIDYQLTINDNNVNNPNMGIAIIAPVLTSGNFDFDYIELTPRNIYATDDPDFVDYTNIIDSNNRKSLANIEVMAGDIGGSYSDETSWGVLYYDNNEYHDTDYWGPKGGTKNKALLKILADDITNEYNIPYFMLSGEIEGTLLPVHLLKDITDNNKIYMQTRFDMDVYNRSTNLDAVELLT